MKKINKKTILIIASIPLVVALLLLAGGNISQPNTVLSGAGYMMSESHEYTKDMQGAQPEYIGIMPPVDSHIGDGSKIVNNGNVSIETLEFDKVIDKIKSLSFAHNGTVGYINMNNGNIYQGIRQARSSNMQFKVPAENFNAFLEELRSVAHVTNENVSSNDVSWQYYDTETRLETLKVQEERLLELLKNGSKLEDILAVERELSDVRYQIEYMMGEMRRMDNSVKFSTLNVYVLEVFKETSVVPSENEAMSVRLTFALKQGLMNFKDGFANILIFLAENIVIVILAIALLIMLHRRYKRQVPKVHVDVNSEVK